jgi:hypothetical protein
MIIATSIVGVVGFTGYGLTAWSQTIELRDELTKLPPHVKAVLYAMPLVIMDVTREESLAGSGAIPNQFLHVRTLLNDTFRTVVRPNVDTLYSTAWLDLTAEPVVMTLPPSDGRFFMIQCMDAWTNVFADPGIRTLGNKEGKYEIVGPDWQGQALAGAEVIRAPTRMVWTLARVFVRDGADLTAARDYQSRLDIRPLSHLDDPTFQSGYPRPGERNRNPIMMDVLKEMGPKAFFERFTRLTVANPAAPQDAPFITDVLEPLGIASNQSKAWDSIDPSDRKALAKGLEQVLNTFSDRISFQQQHRHRVNGWDMPGQGPIGSYGTHYAVRAAVALLGLAAKDRADGTHFNASVDGSGNRLDGSKMYRLTFGPGDTPPAQAFWSITLYDDKGYLAANPIGRHAIRPSEGLVYESDGSLAIYLQPDNPGPERLANWLPTPRGQTYELSLRAYWPNEALLKGQWMPPPIVLVN